MNRIDVHYTGGSYPVMIGVNYINSTIEFINQCKCSGKVLIISDTNVFHIYGEALVKALKKEDYHVGTHIIKAGEESKNLETVGKIYNQLFDLGISRDDMIIALGGGVVGDIAGFAAGTYLRGVKYMQIPTTLLAQVDSSVGGKTGVDTENGKNQIGMFYQPCAVVIDIKMLGTLNKEVLNDGMAEVIKYGLIRDISLFNLLKDIKEERDFEDLIFRCINIKADIVSRDEKDTGERMLLNFGHTFGHGIEKCGNFKKYSHGNAVSIGMVMAAELGEKLGITKEGTAVEIINICKLFDLPTEPKENIKQILEAMLTDKKISGSSINFILLKSIGESVIHSIKLKDLSKAMSEKLLISPRALIGKVKAIPSKSFIHRALICAALSRGESIIHHIIYSEDVLATIDALSAIGAGFNIEENKIIVKGIFQDSGGDVSSFGSEQQRVKVERFGDEMVKINCKESGSTLRFMVPISAALGLRAELSGSGRLPIRPINAYFEIFDMNSITYIHPEGRSIPLELDGRLASGNYKISGVTSSQFISGLLMALPLCSGDSTLEVSYPFESKGYVDITISVMNAFGVKIEEEINNNICKYIIPGNGSYKKSEYFIEGDWSQAAPWLCMGAINGEIEVEGLNEVSLQGDMEILNILKRFGADIKIENGLISSKTSTMTGINIDGSQIPDIVPALAVVAAFAQGTSRIENCGRLRFKESDRLETTMELLSKLGADVKIDCDSLVINGNGQLKGGMIESHQDHRIVMAASIAAAGTIEAVTINGYNSIKKSYPKYFKDYEKLGGEIDGIDIW
ncbi:MAG: 3-dehydroquinate synthase [Eubacteriales bacterium]